MAAAAASSTTAGSAAATEPVFKFYRKDFGKLQTRPLHMDLDFDITETKVRVVARTTFVHVRHTADRGRQLQAAHLSTCLIMLCGICSDVARAGR